MVATERGVGAVLPRRDACGGPPVERRRYLAVRVRTCGYVIKEVISGQVPAGNPRVR